MVLAATCFDASSAQPFSYKLLRSDLDVSVYGSVSWADADLDGRMDIVLTGSPSHSEPFTPGSTLYLTRQKTGSGDLTRQEFDVRELPVNVWHSASGWSDVDRDGDPDLVLLGATTTEPPYEGRTVLLENDGDGNLSVLPVDLPPLFAGSVDWGDFDNDGDEDLLLTGVSEDGFKTALYRSDSGTFSPFDAGLVDVGYGTAQFGDYDGDGDLDVVVTGQSSDEYLTRIYENEDGVFESIAIDPTLGLAFSAAAWGDADADGDLDLLLAGGVLSEQLYSGRTYLLSYRGAGHFDYQPLGADGLLGGSVAWGDVDLDGDPDALVTGSYYPRGPKATRIYFNNPARFDAGIELPGTLFGEAAPGDHDGDGDLDLVLTGTSVQSRELGILFENTNRIVNDPPSAPQGLSASVEGDRVSLSWDASVDDFSTGLTYSVRIGSTEDGVDVVSPLADPRTGVRYIVGPGNVIQNTSWSIKGLAPGTYFWSVQAIDQAFVGSVFPPPQSFTVNDTSSTSE